MQKKLKTYNVVLEAKVLKHSQIEVSNKEEAIELAIIYFENFDNSLTVKASTIKIIKCEELHEV